MAAPANVAQLDAEFPQRISPVDPAVSVSASRCKANTFRPNRESFPEDSCQIDRVFGLAGAVLGRGYAWEPKPSQHITKVHLLSPRQMSCPCRRSETRGGVLPQKPTLFLRQS